MFVDALLCRILHLSHEMVLGKEGLGWHGLQEMSGAQLQRGYLSFNFPEHRC